MSYVLGRLAWPEVPRHPQQLQHDRKARVCAKRSDDACRELPVVLDGASAVCAASQGRGAPRDNYRREPQATAHRCLWATGVAGGVFHDELATLPLRARAHPTAVKPAPRVSAARLASARRLEFQAGASDGERVAPRTTRAPMPWGPRFALRRRNA